MSIVPIGLIAALCLAFASTRLIGVVFIAILASLFPWPILGIVLIAAAAYFIYLHKQRSSKNAN